MNLRNGKRYVNDYRAYWLPEVKELIAKDYPYRLVGKNNTEADGIIYSICERFIYKAYFGILI